MFNILVGLDGKETAKRKFVFFSKQLPVYGAKEANLSMYNDFPFFLYKLFCNKLSRM